MIRRFEQLNQIKLNYQFAPRRTGDVAVCFANAEKAQKELGFVGEFDLNTMFKDAWHWQCKNLN